MSGLPEQAKELINDARIRLGDTSAVRSIRSLGGGCINHATRLETERSVYFMKWNAGSFPGMFESEAQGLTLLARTGTVRVPRVLAVAKASETHPAYIVLEWLEAGDNRDQGSLGEQLAALHLEGHSPGKAPAYGLDHDNYIGQNPQINDWDANWPFFFAERRIRPQIELARHNSYLSYDRRRRLERLVERVPALLDGVDRRPALVHGDLWSGNVIAGPDGLALIDPAVSFSDREAEIAFTELFGGFSSRFYTAYESVWPLEPGYRDRRDLYNLYHLLNHLNLFGESYAYQVDAILRRYVG